MYHVFKLTIFGDAWKLNSEKRCCIHIVLKTAIQETGSKYIQNWPNKKWEVETAIGVGPERVGSCEQP